jgi:hypothetical protein
VPSLQETGLGSGAPTCACEQSIDLAEACEERKRSWYVLELRRELSMELHEPAGTPPSLLESSGRVK